MRNKHKFIALALSISLMMPALVLAQSNTDTQNTGETETMRKQNAQNRIMDAREKVEKTKQDRANAVKRLALVQVQRTEKAVKQMSEMVGKIETVISRLKTQGVDVAAIQASLDRAKLLQSEAESMLAALKTKYTSIDPTSTDPKRQVQAFMADMNAIKKKLIEVHKALKDVVKQIRSLEKPKSNSEAPNASGEGQ